MINTPKARTCPERTVIGQLLGLYSTFWLGVTGNTASSMIHGLATLCVTVLVLDQYAEPIDNEFLDRQSDGRSVVPVGGVEKPLCDKSIEFGR
jgi:hypothetical protein